jgi:hypothetical protein
MLVETGRGEESRRAVELCYRLAFLEGRRLAGLPLSLGEASQLAALAPLGGEPQGRRRHRRVAVALQASARLAGKDQLSPLLVLNISAGGIFAASDAPPAVGTALQLRLACEQVEYSFPCVVQWRSARGVGLRFTGIPLELRRGPASGATAARALPV